MMAADGHGTILVNNTGPRMPLSVLGTFMPFQAITQIWVGIQCLTLTLSCSKKGGSSTIPVEVLPSGPPC